MERLTSLAKPKEHPEHLGKYFCLLLSLAILLLVLPIAERTRRVGIVLLLSIAVAIAFAVLAAGRNRRQLTCASILASPCLALKACLAFDWFDIGDETWPNLIIAPFFAAFWLYISITIFRAFMQTSEFTRDKICGAICVFLLIGVTWASLYISVQLVLPDSFVVVSPGADPVHRLTPSQAVYFSYLTMATMGYGDIAPNNNIVRTVAYSQAIVGVLYIAVFIARVVSLYEAHYQRHREKSDQ